MSYNVGEIKIFKFIVFDRKVSCRVENLLKDHGHKENTE